MQKIPAFLFALLFFMPAVSAAPANDDFAGAIAVTTAPAAYTIDTTGATTEPGEFTGPYTTCDDSYVHSTVWFKLTTAEAGTMVAEADGTAYNTVLAVFKGTDLASLEFLHCSNPAYPTPPLVPWLVEPGETYYVQAGARTGDPTGILDITFELLETPANDLVADATVITTLPTTITGTTYGATVTRNSPCHVPGTVDVWYQFTPTENTPLNAPGVEVFEGAALEDLVSIDNCGNEPTVSLTAGTTYSLRVDHSKWAWGPFSIDLGAAPINDEQERAIAIQPYANILAKTIHATVSAGEHQPCRIHRTLWYTWEPTAPGFHRVTGTQQGGTGMAVVAVYGEDGGRHALRSCETQPTAGTRAITDFYATPGTTYYFQVGIQGATNAGDVQFTLSKLPPTNMRPETLLGPALGGISYYI